MSALFLELARTVLFRSSFSIRFRLRMIFLNIVLAPHVKVAKALLVARLATHKFFVLILLVLNFL